MSRKQDKELRAAAYDAGTRYLKWRRPAKQVGKVSERIPLGRMGERVASQIEATAKSLMHEIERNGGRRITRGFYFKGAAI